MKKRKTITAVTIFILTITIILNICLLTAPVVKGKAYSYKNETKTCDYYFYDNTYSTNGHYLINGRKYFSQAADLYTYTNKEDIETSNSSKVRYDELHLFAGFKTYNYGVTERDYYTLYRCSVFKYTNSIEPNEDAEFYYCKFAIFLQVIYALTVVSSIIVLICINKST